MLHTDTLKIFLENDFSLQLWLKSCKKDNLESGLWLNVKDCFLSKSKREKFSVISHLSQEKTTKLAIYCIWTKCYGNTDSDLFPARMSGSSHQQVL